MKRLFECPTCAFPLADESMKAQIECPECGTHYNKPENEVPEELAERFYNNEVQRD